MKSLPYQVFLAPLAGVSDYPFRSVCAELGADVTYVEMISSRAFNRQNKRTFDMLYRDPEERLLGVQVTGPSPEDIGPAVAGLNALGFETIDLNMGCPVTKVVQTGCGAGLLQDPELVYRVVEAAVQNTDKPLSVKIRLGWDRQHLNFLEIGQAIAAAKASWITVHGRARNERYDTPVHLDAIALLKKQSPIPVVGNGDLLSLEAVHHMRQTCQVDGVMISRGAMGNPWIFKQIKENSTLQPTPDEWLEVPSKHLERQERVYQHTKHGEVMMRKHLLWYLGGWPGAKRVKQECVKPQSFANLRKMLEEFHHHLSSIPGLRREL